MSKVSEKTFVTQYQIVFKSLGLLWVLCGMPGLNSATRCGILGQFVAEWESAIQFYGNLQSQATYTVNRQTERLWDKLPTKNFI